MTWPFVWSWKKALIGAGVALIVGLALFALVGSALDSACPTDAPGLGCHVYGGWRTAIEGYADVWRQWVAPQCLGGVGPDDCLGPDVSIMALTLVIGGAIVGGTSRQKRLVDNSRRPQ